MRVNGVEKTVLVHVIHYRWDCRYAGDALKAHREKFMGVCRVNPTADSAAYDLSRWVARIRIPRRAPQSGDRRHGGLDQ